MEQSYLYQSFLAARIMAFCNSQGIVKLPGKEEVSYTQAVRTNRDSYADRVERFLLEEERFLQVLTQYGIRPDKPAKGKYDRETREARIQEAYLRVEKAWLILRKASPCNFYLR